MKQTHLSMSLALVVACSDTHATEPVTLAVVDGSTAASQPSIDAGSIDASVVTTNLGDGSAPDAGPDPCLGQPMPPTTLLCTGLYADLASKTLAANARPYAPAVPLWSDGAGKERWIVLPPGTKIDVSNPSEWLFPVGTKLFKQFTYEGKRVETRMFVKLAQNDWVHATYAWNADDSAATISYGATVPVDADGGTWVIPTGDDCDSCHRGRTDRILGFEEVSLGLEGATGLTLPELARQGLLSADIPVNLTVGDDGTGLSASALSWLHVNCGVTCHNVNENSDGYGAKMDLRLDPTLLDGSPPSSSWGPIATTVDVACVSGSVQGTPRITPGDPTHSAVVQLITSRGDLQMPPIASRVVDQVNVAALTAWVRALPSSADAGVRSASDGGRGPTRPPTDAAVDASSNEPPVTEASDAATPDDAGAP